MAMCFALAAFTLAAQTGTQQGWLNLTNYLKLKSIKVTDFTQSITGNRQNVIPTEKAVSDAILAAINNSKPTLQEVADEGSTTTNTIGVGALRINGEALPGGSFRLAMNGDAFVNGQVWAEGGIKISNPFGTIEPVSTGVNDIGSSSFKFRNLFVTETNTGNILPNASATYDIGTVTNKFRNGFYSGAVNAATLSLSGNASVGSLTAYGVITAYSNIMPVGHNNIDLGSHAIRFRNLYLGSNAYVNGAISSNSTISAAGAITSNDGAFSNLMSSTLTYIDGNEADGKVLVSDGSGKANWKYAQNLRRIKKVSGSKDGSNYDVDIDDDLILVESGDVCTVTLPDVTTCEGKVYEFSMYGLHAANEFVDQFTLLTSSSQVFDVKVGCSFMNVRAGVNTGSSVIVSTRVVSDGIKWIVLQGDTAMCW